MTGRMLVGWREVGIMDEKSVKTYLLWGIFIMQLWESMLYLKILSGPSLAMEDEYSVFIVPWL